MKLETLHSVGDKSVYDALCQTVKVKNSDFRELFLRRGTICSPKTDKKELAAYFATMVHDFNDYAMLSDLLGTSSNREKSASVSIRSSADIGDIKSAAETLKESIENTGLEMVAQTKWYEYGLKVDVVYKEFNPNKNEFSQYVTKVASIIVEKTDDGVKARHPDNPKIKSLADQLMKNIGSEVEEETNPERISLFEVADSDQRNSFFISLINEVKGYSCDSVTDVSLYRPKSLSSFSPDRVDEYEDYGLEEDVVADTYIIKASFKGQDILKSKSLKSWYDKGFYICKISWRALKDKDSTFGQYVLEAGMSDPESFSGFNYMVKGNCSHHGAKDFAEKWKRLDAQDERKISGLIEDAGAIVARKTIEKYREAEKTTVAAIDTAAKPAIEIDAMVDPSPDLGTTTEQSDGTL